MPLPFARPVAAFNGLLGNQILRVDDVFVAEIPGTPAVAEMDRASPPRQAGTAAR